LPPPPICLLAIESAVLLDASLPFGEQFIQFTRLEVAELLLLAERHDGRSHHIFRAGILARCHPLVNTFCTSGLSPRFIYST